MQECGYSPYTQHHHSLSQLQVWKVEAAVLFESLDKPSRIPKPKYVKAVPSHLRPRPTSDPRQIRGSPSASVELYNKTVHVGPTRSLTDIYIQQRAIFGWGSDTTLSQHVILLISQFSNQPSRDAPNAQTLTHRLRTLYVTDRLQALHSLTSTSTVVLYAVQAEPQCAASPRCPTRRGRVCAYGRSDGPRRQSHRPQCPLQHQRCGSDQSIDPSGNKDRIRPK